MSAAAASANTSSRNAGLTRLSWSQPLAASIRLVLASNQIPVAAMVDGDGVPLDDTAIRRFIADYTMCAEMLDRRDRGEEHASAWFDKDIFDPVHVRHRARPDAPLADEPDETRSLAPVVEMLRTFVRAYRDHRPGGDRSRPGAIAAVVLAELGWPVNCIADLLDVSRLTVSTWLGNHVDVAATADEIATFNEILVQSFDYFLLDLRTTDFLTRRTALSWRRVMMLPPSGIVHILSALARVSYRLRATSSEDKTACSELFDIMLDLLLRRGMKYLTLAQCLGMTHHAILERVDRSDTVGFADKHDPDVWNDWHELIAKIDSGFAPFDQDLDADDYTLLTRTVTHIHSAQEPRPDRDQAVLVKVRTTPSIEKTASGQERRGKSAPSVSVYVLAAPDWDDLTDDELERMYLLDYAGTPAVERTMAQYCDKKFAPLALDRHRADTAERIEAMLARLRAAPAAPISPLTDSTVMAALYDVDRFGHPGIAPPSQWDEGIVQTEALLMEALNAGMRTPDGRPRVDPVEAAGLSSEGVVTYHWLPAQVLADELIYLGFRERHELEMQKVVREKAIEFPDQDEFYGGQLNHFLPPHVHERVLTWLKRFRDVHDPDFDAPVLWTCLFRPQVVTATYPVPRSPERAPRVAEGSEDVDAPDEAAIEENGEEPANV
jgi:hypothetical protein